MSAVHGEDAAGKCEEKASREVTSLQLAAICVAQLNEAIQVTMPYTVAVYMVRDFEAGTGGSEEAIGRLTGLLAACFCAAQFLSSFPWGRVSDRVGRKPMLLMSNFSSMASVIAFGLATNYSFAAVCRLGGGFFNCTFVCLKSMIGESADMAGQAVPLSYLSLMWGLGTIMGPTIGGFLARPCSTYGSGFPLCAPGQLLAVRPYFLPCLVAGLVSFAALVSTALVLSETLPRLAARRYARVAHLEQGLQGKARPQELPGDATTETELAALAARSPFPDGPEQGAEEEAAELSCTQAVADLAEGPEAIDAGTSEATNGKNDDPGAEKEQGPPPGRDEGFWEDTVIDVQPTDDGEGAGTSAASEEEERLLEAQVGKIAAEEAADVVWWRSKQVLLTVLGYGCFAFLFNVVDEVTPIFGSAPRSDGGLALSTSQLALPLAIGGVILMTFALKGYPWAQKKFGLLPLTRFGIMASMPLFAAIAAPSFLPLGTLARQLVLAGVLSLKNVAATAAFTSSVIMVNAAAPQKDMGSVNGASQALASFVRAVGPALGGVLWGLSVLPFALAAAGFLAPLIIYRYVELPALRDMGRKGSANLAH